MTKNDPERFAKALLQTLMFRWRKRRHSLTYIPWAANGFFANLRAIMQQVKIACWSGYVPVVVSSRYALERFRDVVTISPNLYWSADGHQGASNTWEYYFEPTVSVPFDFLSIRDIQATYENPLHTASSSFIEEYHRYGYTKPHWAKVCGPSDFPTTSYRESMQHLLGKYARVRGYILNKVDQFWTQNLAGQRVTGVHIRGGDHPGRESAHVPLKAYVDLVNAHLEFDRIYLATDCEETWQEMARQFGERLISYPVQRGTGSIGIHNRTDIPKPVLGEEVLIEALLLSRCQMYVHGNSAMNFGVLCWNPGLPHKSVYGDSVNV